MHRTKVIVVGYPRSGNTWLARLLGECLDSPVERYRNAVPIAEEGLDRKGKFIVHQMHLKPLFGYDYKYNQETFPDSYLFNTWRWKDEKLIHIIRDPRDVVVSVWFYWNIQSLTKALRCVGEGLHPVAVHGPWSEFIKSWREVIPYVTYEELYKDPCGTIEYVLRSIEIEEPSEEKIETAVFNQSFAKKKHKIENETGVKRPYGKSIQLKALRHGVTGDWEDYFTNDQLEIAYEYFGLEMTRLGYERK